MNKKLILLPISAVMVFMMAGLVNAAPACTFDQTATTVGTKSTYVNGVINLSITMSGQVDNGDNASVAILTNDITSTTYVSNTSFGANRTQLSNKSVDTAQFLDTETVTFTYTVKNETQETVVTCTRAYVTDNTEPKCSFASGLVSSETYAPTQKWTVSCANASSATLKFGSNAPKTMTAGTNAVGGNTCTFTGDKSKVPEGTYQTLLATPSDGLNTTTCSLSSIRIEIGIPLKQVAALAASGSLPKAGASTTGSNNTALIVIVGLAALWFIRKKK